MPLTKPTVGGSTNSWGQLLNDSLDFLNGAIVDINVFADTLLPRAGGLVTGRLITTTESMGRVELAATSGTITVDLALGNYFMIPALTGNCNIVFANIPTGIVATGWLIRIINPGAFAITWDSANPRIKWPGGVVPAPFTAAGIDTFLCITDNNGDSIRIALLLRDSKVAS